MIYNNNHNDNNVTNSDVKTINNNNNNNNDSQNMNIKKSKYFTIIILFLILFIIKFLFISITKKYESIKIIKSIIYHNSYILLLWNNSFNNTKHEQQQNFFYNNNINENHNNDNNINNVNNVNENDIRNVITLLQSNNYIICKTKQTTQQSNHQELQQQQQQFHNDNYSTNNNNNNNNFSNIILQYCNDDNFLLSINAIINDLKVTNITNIISDGNNNSNNNHNNNNLRTNRGKINDSELNENKYSQRQQIRKLQENIIQEKMNKEEIQNTIDVDINKINKENTNIFFILYNIIGVIICLSTAALGAGLTLGMLGLDPLLLLIKERASINYNERIMASKLLPIIKQHHLLLVTLLLLNSIANETLPIFLEKLTSTPIIAIITSVILVLFFGEIMPSAIFTGPNQLIIASKLVPLVQIVIFILYPIAKPIALLLDYLLGGHSSSSSNNDNDNHDEFINYDRGELAALIRIQYEGRLANKRRMKSERKFCTKPIGYVDDHIGSLDFTTTSIKQTIRSVKNNINHNNNDIIINNSNHNNIKVINEPIIHTKSAPLDLHTSSDSNISDNDYNNNNNIDSNATEADMYKHHYNKQPERSASIELDEVMMVEGALQMKTKVAFDVFTSLRIVFAIPNTMILNDCNMVRIYASGYTRIPVYDEKIGLQRKNNKTAIIGILATRMLIVIDPKDLRTVGSLPLRKPKCISPGTRLVDLLNMFQTGGVNGGHLALVCALPSVGNKALEKCFTNEKNNDEKIERCLPEKAGLMGIITLEDVLEMLLQEQIYDEMDSKQRSAHRLAIVVCRRWKKYAKKCKYDRLLKEQQQNATELLHNIEDAMNPNESTSLLYKR